MVYICIYGRLAQLVERLIDVEKVTGSNPVPPTDRAQRELLAVSNVPAHIASEFEKRSDAELVGEAAS